MKRPRKHHFIPKFYLKGFTESGTENGRLFVLDQSLSKQWESSPNKSATEQDMYEVAAGIDTDPAAFENAFANLEGKFGKALKDTIDTWRLPEGDTLNVLLNFVMMMAIRVPAIRGSLEEINDVLHKQLLRKQIATTQGWESFMQMIREQGKEIPAEDEYKLKGFINGDDYTIGQGQNWYLKMMVEVSRDLHPLLLRRKWVLSIASEDSPDFVCSDFPVAVSWLSRPVSSLPPAHGLPNTVVTFPLNRRMAILGTFEGGLRGGIVKRQTVAGINTTTAMHAKQVYSAQQDFVYSNKKRILSASDLLESLNSRRNTGR